jgi:filamentous hemagglutinin
VQALAAATAGLAAYNGAQALATSASTGGGVSVSATYGSSQSHSESSEASSTLSGSQVRAGGDLTIVATGGGTASDLTVIGSSLAAGHNLTLAADHAILLESGQNTDTSSSQSSSSGWGVGAAATYGSKGIAVGFTANASKSRGTGNGSDLSNVDTTVTAGNLLSLSSGGDTSLLGALLSGQQVVAAVGGDLTLASRQDTSTYHSDNQSLGGSLTVGAGVAGSVNYSKEKIASNYASVTEQTGIHAGDGGFQISVQGNTGLQGAVITSSDAAVANNKNTLSTGTLTVSDLQNHSDYNATSVSLSAGGGKSMGSAATGSGVHLAAVQTGVSGGAMAMSASGSDSSTTLSGISGGALTIGNGAKQQALTGQTAEAAVVGVNRAVSTGKDGTNRVANTFDLDDIETGFAVTRAFGQEVGTFVAAKAANAAQLKAALDQELLNVNKDPNLVKQLTDELSEAATWAQGGTSRQVLTALAAAASGNITGSGLQMVQGALVNFVQQQGASFIGDLVHGSNGQLGIIKEGSPEQAALQAIVAAGGSLAMGQDPLSGAAGAAASSLLTNLFKVDPDMSQADKDAQRNLMLTLVTGMAAGLGGDATSANASAFAALDDNAQSTKNSTKKAIAAGNAAQSNQTWVDPILNQTNPYWTQTKQLATDIAGLNPLINGVMLAKSIKDGNFSNFSSNFIGSTPELGTIWSGINVAGDVVGFGGIFIRDSIIVPMVTNDSRGPQAVDVNGHYNQFYDEASPSSW